MCSLMKLEKYLSIILITKINRHYPSSYKVHSPIIINCYVYIVFVMYSEFGIIHFTKL